MAEDTDKKLGIEESFNLIVQLARNAKLSWNEHRQVHAAVEVVYNALNDKKTSAQEAFEEEQEE
jgi:hypothetical protein